MGKQLYRPGRRSVCMTMISVLAAASMSLPAASGALPATAALAPSGPSERPRSISLADLPPLPDSSVTPPEVGTTKPAPSDGASAQQIHPEAAPAAPDDAAARQKARQLGEDVVVSSKTSETTRIFAKPDGTMAAELASDAVRVTLGTEDNKRWALVDTTLVSDASGVHPKAAVGGMSLASFYGLFLASRTSSP